MEFLRPDEDWVVRGLEHLKKQYVMNDKQLAEFLSTTPGMLAQVRFGKTRATNALKFEIANKLGWVRTVEGLAWLAGQMAGEKAAEKVEKTILGLVNVPKIDDGSST